MRASSAVPLLVRLYDGNFRFTSAKPDGSDIRFLTDDDKTPLSYHIEKFDPLLNEAFVWVKIPDLKPGAKTTLWLYYGNAGNKAVKVEDPKATYDDSTVLVYHFSEHGQPAYDFTGGGNNALNAGGPNDGAIIGTGLRLDGKTQITIPQSPSLAWPGGAAFTWSFWVKYTAPQPNAIILSRHGKAGGSCLSLGWIRASPSLCEGEGRLGNPAERGWRPLDHQQLAASGRRRLGAADHPLPGWGAVCRPIGIGPGARRARDDRRRPGQHGVRGRAGRA